MTSLLAAVSGGAGRERKTPTKVSPWDPAENPPSVQPSEPPKRNLRGFSTDSNSRVC
ncbi:uncharacterized protein P884DRAFT_99188 [Thermothelomyces heterothallicus CBS 202.75]|uniref:uncharacterized protein n=1 Tax=Thermothelomyces heterothallicus CBS 202.75 TaxID=1149848 RepID=UPI003743D750